MKYCRKTLSLLCLCGLSLLNACGSKKAEPSGTAASRPAAPEEAPATGTFVVGDKTVTGRISVERISPTREFSILCQNDAEGLMRVTFKDEIAARSTKNFDLVERPATGLKDKMTAEVSFQPPAKGALLSSRQDSGTVTVTRTRNGNEVSFSGVRLQSQDKKAEQSVSGNLEY